MKGLFPKQFWREMLPLAIPIALQNLLMASFRLVDMLMIGRLGGDALAAVDLGSQISFLVDILSFGVSSGAAVFIAQYHGAGDRDGIHRVLGCAAMVLLPLGVLAMLVGLLLPTEIMSILTDDAVLIELGTQYLSVAAFSYLGIVLNSVLSTVLRSTENVRLPLIASGFSAALNAFLNYGFIFGNFGLPALGVRGAGLATAISATTGPLILLIVSLIRRNILFAPLSKIFAVKGFLKPYWKRSLPALLNEMVWSLSIVVVNAIFGHMGAENYAGLSTYRTVENLVFVFFVGLCHACNVLIGKHIGQGDEQGAKRMSKAFLLLTPMMGLVLGGLVLLLRTPILSLFDISETSRHVARSLLLLFSLEMGLRNIPYLMVVGVFRGGGDTKTGFIGDCLVQYAIVIPAAAILGLWLKLPFVTTFVIMQLCDDVAKLLVYTYFYRKGTWIRPVAKLYQSAER